MTETVQVTLPPEKGKCKMIDAENAGEVIRLLREEAKVL